ncbi:hypothetical protein PCS92_07965 [Escherichia coli]|uniref:hypothetical protein n=1 Tax=Escherichia coli TaxID=562 RepID=UPI000789AD77|nr:hypothetical protein [Escherichia coli]KYO68225.1 hypothetical protein LT27_02506 [Escherichia coli]QMB14437.1 hypothetical protein HV009_08160 [Escherichia coli]WMO82331.1 hypothetical protein PCS92_07965 [Escherichia coli]
MCHGLFIELIADIKKPTVMVGFFWDFWSAREDLNLRPPTPHVTAPETLETAPLLGWQGVSLCAQTVHNSQNSRYIHQ